MKTGKAAAIVIALSIGSGLGAQPRRDLQDFEYIRESNPWLYFSNASGLASLQTDRAATAGISYGNAMGGLTGINDSDNCHDAGVSTEAFLRVSERMAVHGLLSYDYFYGKNMGGSVFWLPSYNPIDLIEFSETTTGTKIREQYHLYGALAYLISDHWSVSAAIDYTAGDYAKRKDPRYKNVLLDMEVSAGCRWAPSEAFSLGFNFLYIRRMESLTGKVFGDTATNYFTFVDYGGFFGSKEIFSGDYGYMPAESATRPMLNNIFGGALQFETGQKVKTYHELKYLHRSGFYGNRASTDVVYCEFAGNTASYEGSVILNIGGNKHKIGVRAVYEGLDNNENIYRKTTNPGENTVTEYLGSKEVLSRTDLSAKVEYDGWIGIKDNRPEWKYGIGLAFDRRSQTATIYPFYRISNIMEFSLNLHGSKDFSVKKNIFTPGIIIAASAGAGNPQQDGQLASSSSGSPVSADGYLNRDFEYRTIPRASASVAFRYTRLINNKFSIWMEVSDTYIHSLRQVSYLAQNYRNMFNARIGFSF